MDKFKLSLANIALNIHLVKKAETLNQEQLRELQRKRFLKLLRHAVSHSEFYRDYYKAHGIDVERLDQVAIEDLPIIDKQIMMENFDSLVCDQEIKRGEVEKFIGNPEMADSKYKGKYEVIHTSGTSGRIGLFVYGPADWSIVKALVFTRVSKNRLHILRKSKYAYFGAVGGHFAGISLAKDAPGMFFDFLPLDINRPIHESVTALNRFMPDSINGYSSGIYLLALEQLKGNLRISPERIICSADHLTPNMSEVVHKAFGVRSINFYAATEAICMAVQCDLYGRFHMFNDWHIFEIIRKDGKPAEPGETGNLVITNLYNYTQPLIRYRMDDEMAIDTGKCPCGWGFPLIKDIAGREEEFIYFMSPDGNVEYIHPIVFVEFFVDGLEKLQVVQVGRNDLKLNVVVRGDKDSMNSRISSRMDEILEKKKLTDLIRYEINVVDDIPNDQKTGKYRLIIPLKD